MMFKLESWISRGSRVKEQMRMVFGDKEWMRERGLRIGVMIRI